MGDFIGKKFGRLTVVAFDSERSVPHKQRWICRCDCGTAKSILRNNLTQGGVKSCGCLQREICKENSNLPIKIAQDISGFISGSLTVLEMVPDSHPPKCRCICECGNMTIVDARKIRSRVTKSCGCGMRKLRNSLIGKRFDKLIVVERVENYRSPVTGQSQIQYRCICDCGGEIVVHASALTQGFTRSCGCIRSIAERRIESLFERIGIPYQCEYRFGDCRDKRELPFDFAIFDTSNNLIALIELDGSQHYKPAYGRNIEYTQHHDKIKNEYCVLHNIPLIRIPYWNFEDVEEAVLKELEPYVHEPFAD